MTANELIAEGRQLQRPAAFLRQQGTGPIVAKWYDRDEDEIEQTGQRCWLTIDTKYIPGFSKIDAPYITVFTNEQSGEGGQAAVSSSWPERDGTTLYAIPTMALPPIDAVFARGSVAVDSWLQTFGVKRGDRFLSSLPDQAIKDYDAVWTKESAYSGADVFAVLGGWHMTWPDDDFNELLEDQLLAWTLQDSEPWVELWHTKSGQFRVIQRIT